MNPLPRREKQAHKRQTGSGSQDIEKFGVCTRY